MAEQRARRDSNFVTTLIGVDNIGYTDPTTVAVDPTTHGIVITGSITASPASNGATGSAVPASADYEGINVGGTLRGATGVNPSGSVYATQIDLASVGGTSFALGQQLATASLPVVLTAAQIITLTPPTNTGYALDSSLTTIDTDLKANITLHAGTNNIGVVDIADTAGNKFSSNSTTFTAKFGLDTNLLGTLGTAFTTAGKVDVKGADGDVFVRQATAANFNATVVGTGTFAVQATPVTQVDTFMLGGVNIKEINAVAPLMGNGGTGTGVLRVALVSDGTGRMATLDTLTNQTQEGGVNISLNAGAVDTGTRRIVQANGAGKTIVSLGGSAASSGNNTLVSSGTNRLKVFAFSLSTTSTTAMTCIFQSGASGTELWRVILQAGTSVSTGANLVVTPPAWLFATASATLLNLNLSSANAVHWSVSYFDEA